MRCLLLLAFVATSACHSATPSHAASARRDATAAASSAIEQRAPVGDSATDAGQPVDHGVVISDVRLMSSGNFTEDSIGPDEYRKVLARLFASPVSYLLEAHAQAARSTHAQLAEMHFDNVVRLYAADFPAAAAAHAKQIVPLYERALVQARVAPGWDGETRLLEMRIGSLERIASGSD